MADKKNFFNATFVFCGSPMIPKQDKATRPWVNEGETKNGDKALSISFGVKNSGNCVYVESRGYKNDIIKTYDKEGNQLDVKWDDRFNEDKIKEVVQNRRFIVNLTERKEFLTEWDMIECLKEELPGFDGNIVVRGRYKRTPAKPGSKIPFYDHYEIRSVVKASEKAQPQHKVKMELYYDKNSIDTSDLKTDKVIHFSGLTPTYIASENENMLTPIEMNFNVGAYDTNDEKQKCQLNVILKHLQPKGKGYYHAKWAVMAINGAEEVPFSIDSLTDAQREFVECGLKTLEDYRQSYNGTIYSERKKEMRLFMPDLTGNFADGMVPADYTNREIEDMTFVQKEDESLESMIGQAAATSVKDEADDESDIDGSDGFDINIF